MWHIAARKNKTIFLMTVDTGGLGRVRSPPGHPFSCLST
jgi:hypothetical protein